MSESISIFAADCSNSLRALLMVADFTRVQNQQGRLSDRQDRAVFAARSAAPLSVDHRFFAVPI